MGNGLLPWWRRRLASRGFAGAALCAIPVAVAALIGFGTSFSGIASGLSAFTSGPGTIPTSAQTEPGSTSRVNRAMVGLASKPGSAGSYAGRGSRGTVTGTRRSGPAGSDGGSRGSSTTSLADRAEGTRGAGDTVSNPVNNTVNNTVGAVDNTVNNTVGTVDNTVDNTVNTVNDTVSGVNNTVNDTVGGVNNTVNGLLNP